MTYNGMCDDECVGALIEADKELIAVHQQLREAKALLEAVTTNTWGGVVVEHVEGNYWFDAQHLWLRKYK